jgi:hypothetical protein
VQPADELADASYARMRWNTPLSTVHADLLLARLADEPQSTLLDLGCGWGELLIQALARGPNGSFEHATATGVDTDRGALDRGRRRADECQVADRVTFVVGEAAGWTEPADRVMCIGASHAWGGTRLALAALMGVVHPDGRLLFGDGCWEKSPSDRAAALFGDEVLMLEDIVDHAMAVGWRVLHLSTADQREWDDFESTWRAGRQEWLLRNGGDPRAAEVRSKLDSQLHDYLTGYRGVLGFCYLLLSRSSA